MARIIKDPQIRYPIHGVLHEGKYVFPYLSAGYIIYATDEELNYGLELGYEYSIIEVITFDRAPYMREYFMELYDLKQHSVSGERMVWKTFMNASCGWFGFNKYDRNVMSIYHDKYEPHIRSLYDIGMCDYSHQNGMIIANRVSNVLTNDTNIAVAAYITSRARLQLHRIMMHVDTLGGRVLYCDTDSIYTDILLSHMVSTNIGQLKLDSRYKTLLLITTKVIAGISHDNGYAIKIKGINTNVSVTDEGDIGPISTDDVINIYEKLKYAISTDSDIVFINSKIYKSRDGKLNGTYLVELLQQISLSLRYNKGLVSDDNIKPLTF